MIVTSRKSKGKTKASSSNVVSISMRETEEDVASLISWETRSLPSLALGTSHTEDSIRQTVPETVRRASSKLSTISWETNRQSTRPSTEYQKELRYVKALLKSGAGPSTPFCFDVLAQLANIPARITLYDLLKLSKSMRDALRESLIDTKVSVTQIHAIYHEEDDNHCHHASK